MIDICVMNEVEEYILNLKGEKREITLFFHELFVEHYQLKPKIRFKIPMYYRNKWLVYLNPSNRIGVELSFIHGFKIPEKFSLIQSKGRKMVKSVEFESLEEIPVKQVKEIIEAAIAIDKTFD